MGVLTMCLLKEVSKHGDFMAQRISKRIVDATPPSEKDVYVWDSELKGFGLKVSPAGRKTYIVQYRIGGRKGRTRRFTIGKHGTLTAEQARKAAKEALGQVSLGKDPASERDKIRGGYLTSDLLDKFDAEHIEVKLKPKTQEDYRRNITIHIKPKIGHMLIHQVTREDMMKLHHAMRETPYAANRNISILSKFFNWCEKYGYRDEGKNPCRFVDKYKEKKRERFLSSEEQERFFIALEKAKRENIISHYAIYAIQLLVLTSARLGEIINLKWDYINWERGTIDLPDSKVGTRPIYLNQPARDILSEITKQTDNPYVCCGAVPGRPIVNIQKSWRRIRTLAAIEDVRLNDLRHTFASVAVSNGVSLHIVGGLLGHTQPRTTARYAHLAADPLIEAAELIGRKLNQARRL